MGEAEARGGEPALDALRRARRGSFDRHPVSIQAESHRRQAVAGRKEADDQTRQAIAGRKEAEANFDEAIAAVDDYLTQVGDSTLLDVPGIEPLRRDLLNSALAFYQKFLARRKGDARLEPRVAAAYMRLGKIQLLRRADESRKLYLQARELYQSIAKTDLKDAEVRLGLAEVLAGAGSTEGHRIDGRTGLRRSRQYPVSSRTDGDPDKPCGTARNPEQANGGIEDIWPSMRDPRIARSADAGRLGPEARSRGNAVRPRTPDRRLSNLSEALDIYSQSGRPCQGRLRSEARIL